MMKSQDSTTFSLRNWTVFERFSVQLTVAGAATLLAVFATLQFNERQFLNSFQPGHEAELKILRATLTTLGPLLPATAKAQNERFRKDARGLVVDKEAMNVKLSSFEDLGWKPGETFNPSTVGLREALRSKDDLAAFALKGESLIWFRWDNELELYLGTVQDLAPYLATWRGLKISILSLLAIGLLSGGLLSGLLVNRELCRPVRGLAAAIGELAVQGHLHSARGLVEALRTARPLSPRHEMRAVIDATLDSIAGLELLSKKAEAIARDELQNPILNAEAKGDLAGSFERTVSFLRRLAESFDRVASGDAATVTMEGLSTDGSLGTSFHKMHGRVQELIVRLSQASHRLEESSHGLQASSSAQASTAAKQADGVTETMATMEELAASSGHIADTAKHVVAIAEETLAHARVGQEAVENVGHGMEDIVKASQRGAERLLNLDEKSRSIGRVATLIAGVAEQSKILALNAAIEAAHAGEAGRGFSVVAEEVRSLAESVFESTREIEDLINEIQNEIRQAVLTSEEEVKRANKGRDLSKNAQETIVAIFSSAEKMTRAAHQIELATNQQRSASGQVATAVRQMAASAEEVAYGAKSVKSSLNELGELAKELHHIVFHFGRNEDTAASAPSAPAR